MMTRHKTFASLFTDRSLPHFTSAFLPPLFHLIFSLPHPTFLSFHFLLILFCLSNSHHYHIFFIPNSFYFISSSFSSVSLHSHHLHIFFIPHSYYFISSSFSSVSLIHTIITYSSSQILVISFPPHSLPSL